jgi:hypothetical protein
MEDQMSEVSKYTVPEEGLKATVEAMKNPSGTKFLSTEQCASLGLEAFIRWQSENPKVFSDEWIVQLVKEAGCADLLGANQFVLGMHQILDLFQRRMYLAPEPEVPEVPEEIEDLLCGGNINTLITEAYRRGKASK